MYIPNSFAEHDIPTMHAFIDAHPLAVVVTNSASDGLMATHLPLVLDRTAGQYGTLVGHFARANPHFRIVAEEPGEALIIFAGPDAYVTPAWYQTKQDTGRVVPTWNYVAVHAYATPQVRDDPQFLRQHLEKLTHRHESSRAGQWQVSDAPEDFIAQQMKAIVGLEFPIVRLEGKWKMSQNRADADIDGVVHGLSESTLERDHVVAGIVNDRRPRR